MRSDACGKLLDLIFFNQPKNVVTNISDPVVQPEDRRHSTIVLKFFNPFSSRHSLQVAF